MRGGGAALVTLKLHVSSPSVVGRVFWEAEEKLTGGEAIATLPGTTDFPYVIIHPAWPRDDRVYRTPAPPVFFHRATCSIHAASR